MTTVLEMAPSYFSSINCIAKKIMKDQDNLKELYPNEWEEMDFDKREELIDSYLIDSTVQEFYKNHPKADDVPKYYPKMVIDSGEKIIIDFDNDGGTWQDEHSAPFAWETKSQMNMPLYETEEDIKSAKLKKIKRPKSPKFVEKRRSGTPLSPELKPSGNSGIWNSPFIAADRGDTADFSGKPEDEHKVEPSFSNSQNDQDFMDPMRPLSIAVENESSDDIFKKYGISFGNRVSPAQSIDKGSSPARSIDKGSSPARSIDKGSSPARSIDKGSSPARSFGDRQSPSRSVASSDRSSPSRFGRLSPKRGANRKSKDREMEKSLISGRDDVQGVVNYALTTQSESDSEKSERSSNRSSSQGYGVINYGQEQSDTDYMKTFTPPPLYPKDLQNSLAAKLTELQITETDLIDEPSPGGSLYENSQPATISVSPDVSSGFSVEPTGVTSSLESVEPETGLSSKSGFDFLDNW